MSTPSRPLPAPLTALAVEVCPLLDTPGTARAAVVALLVGGGCAALAQAFAEAAAALPATGTAGEVDLADVCDLARRYVTVRELPLPEALRAWRRSVEQARAIYDAELRPEGGERLRLAVDNAGGWSLLHGEAQVRRRLPPDGWHLRPRPAEVEARLSPLLRALKIPETGAFVARRHDAAGALIEIVVGEA